METTNLNLSPAEVEMIRIQREKEAIAKQEKELQHKLRMAAFTAKWQQQNNEAARYCAELNQHQSGFSIKQNPRTETFTVWHDAKVIFEQVVNYIEMDIVHESVNKTIEVKEHSSGRYSRHGFKMGFKYAYGAEGRVTKDPKHMASKIKDAIAKNNRERQQKSDEEIGKEVALQTLTAKYPDATITYNKEYHSGYSSRRHSQGYYTYEYKVVFPNGYGVKFTYEYRNNTLSMWLSGSIKPAKFDNDIMKDNDPLNNFINSLQNLPKV